MEIITVAVVLTTTIFTSFPAITGPHSPTLRRDFRYK